MKYLPLTAAAAAVTVSLVTAACSSGSGVPVSAASPGIHVTLAAMPAKAGTDGTDGTGETDGFTGPAGSTAARVFGPGCASMPARGAGSLAWMAAVPVAIAVSGSPMLSDLAVAVRKAQLFMALNGASALTVFAPDNAAFAQIPPAKLAAILANEPELTRILTYQVVAGRVTPAQLASGRTLHTLEGGTIKTAKDGTLDQVNAAHVVCGNVETANATVYIISKVLTP
jgi:uncharacterized surface protein with fasciclin (FAS1) repeats